MVLPERSPAYHALRAALRINQAVARHQVINRRRRWHLLRGAVRGGARFLSIYRAIRERRRRAAWRRMYPRQPYPGRYRIISHTR